MSSRFGAYCISKEEKRNNMGEFPRHECLSIPLACTKNGWTSKRYVQKDKILGLLLNLVLLDHEASLWHISAAQLVVASMEVPEGLLFSQCVRRGGHKVTIAPATWLVWQALGSYSAC